MAAASSHLGMGEERKPALQENKPNTKQEEPTEERKISALDIQLVQNLIERCLQLYMTRRDVVNTLQHQAKIEPGFTSLVWQKLEEQNPEFFRAYYTRLKIKDQIVLFNQLLEQHAQLLQKVNNNVPGKPPTAQKGHAMPPPQYTGMQPPVSHMQHTPGVPVNGMMMPGQSSYPVPAGHQMSVQSQYMNVPPNSAHHTQADPASMQPGMHGVPGQHGGYSQGHGFGHDPHSGHAQMYGSMPAQEFQQPPYVPHSAPPAGMPQAHPGHPHFPQQHGGGGAGGMAPPNPHGQQPGMHGGAMAAPAPGHPGSMPPPANPGAGGEDGANGLHASPSLGSLGTPGGLMDSTASGIVGVTPTRGGAGGGSALPASVHPDDMLSHLPRNLSLSDLSLELSHQLSDGDHGLSLYPGMPSTLPSLTPSTLDTLEETKPYRLPRNFSLSDMSLDFDQNT